MASQKTLPDVDSVIDSARTTQATYAVYFINKIYDPSYAEEKSAEFHSGDLHRVETPRDRMVANCKTGEGHHLSVIDGTMISDASVALAACGINANRRLLSKQIISQRSGKFGHTWRLVVTDNLHIRGYDVNHQGVLVAAFIRKNDASKQLLVHNAAYELSSKLPSKDMFSIQSLSKSFLPK